MHVTAAHQYITVMYMDAPLGKIYSSNAGEPGYDPANPKILKTTAYSKGDGWARTFRCTTVDELADIILDVSKYSDRALVLGFVKGTEPADNIPYSDEYRLISKKGLLAAFNGDEKRLKKPQKINGRLHATRSSEMFERSSWFAFDLDMSPDMPPDLQKLIAEQNYYDILCSLSPNLIDCSHLSVSSASSRVTLNGQPLSKSNNHLYFQCKHPSDLPRYSSSLMVHSLDTPYGYISPHYMQDGVTIDPARRGTPSSVFDRAVFSKARVMFEGAPSLRLNDPHVLTRQISIEPTNITPVNLKHKTVDTATLHSPSKTQQQDARMEFSTSSGSFQVTNRTDLLPETVIEVKDILTNEESTITMRDFVEGDVPRYRAQNPFKRSSKSWSAFLSKENYEGNPCHPYLHSVEFGNFLYNDIRSMFADSTNDPLPDQPAPKYAETTTNAPQTIVQAPLPPVDDNNQQSLFPDQPPKRSAFPNFSTGENVHVYPLPSDLDENFLATEFTDRYFETGGRNLLAQCGGKALFNWVGTHWEKLDAAKLRSTLFQCATEGGVKRVTYSKLNSIFNLAMSYAMSTHHAEPLPSHIIPLRNGLLNFQTGVLMPHSRDWFYTDIKDFDFDPEEKGDGLLLKVLEDASEGDPQFVEQALQMGGYLIAGGDNIAQKIMFFDGRARAGKSLLGQTVSTIAASTLHLEIGSIGEQKIISNVNGKALLMDDDAQSPSYQQRNLVTTNLKKLASGATFQIPQLYTTELFEAYLNPKLGVCCNGIPQLHDPEGAVHDRSMYLYFGRSNVGREDISLPGRMAQPTELSASLNLLIGGYQALLANSGFESLEAFHMAKLKQLKFVQCAASIAAQASAIRRIHPLIPFLEDVITSDPQGELLITEGVRDSVKMHISHMPSLRYMHKAGDAWLDTEIGNSMSRMGYSVRRDEDKTIIIGAAWKGKWDE